MKKICLEAIDVTSKLAIASDDKEKEDRFWELYYAEMYIVEQHQTKTSGGQGSKIEDLMVKFGNSLDKEVSPPPCSSLRACAEDLARECTAYTEKDCH